MKIEKRKIKKEQNEVSNSRKKLGITLLVLVITIILILILASAIIITLSKANPIDEANEAVLKSDIQAMKDNYEIKYKDLLYDKLGDETKIKDSDFDGIIPDKYKEDFTAGKDGLEYIGENEKIKDIAEEMGIGKEKGNNLENVVAVAGIDNIQIEVIVKDKEIVEEYHYYIREKEAEEWKEYIANNNNMVVDGLKEQTTYEVKVKIVGKDGKEEESRIKEVTTKGINAGILIMRENDKNGKEYIEGTWSKENIYIEVSGENTTYTCTGANEVGKTEKASILENEGITKVTVETKVGTNIARKEYEIKIDKTAPEGNIVEKVQIPNGKNDTDTIVKVEGNDNLSGVKEYEFYLDTKPMVVTKEKEYRYENLTDRIHEIKVVIVDKAGNRKEIVEEIVIGVPDANDCIQVEKIPNTWTNTDVKLKITYEGDNIYTPQYSSDNQTWKDVKKVHEENIEQNTKVYARYAYHGKPELLGNVKEIMIDNIDKVVPEILSLTSSNTNATNQNITLTAKAKDNLSGMIAYQFSTDGNLTASSTGWKNITNTKVEMTQTLEVSVNGTYYFYVKDEAGNVSKKEIKINNIDKTAPTLTSIAVTSPATGIYKAGQAIAMVATYSENIKGTTPVLKIKFGTGPERTATAGTINGKTITYTYNIVSGDNGKLASTSYTGSVTDAVGNGLTVANKALTGNAITADTTAPSNTVPTVTSNTNSITATLKQTDSISGINNSTKQYAIKMLDDSAWGEWVTSEAVNYTFHNLTMNTSYQIKTRVSDNVGNTSESQIVTISTVNITRPSITAPTSWTNGDVVVTITYPNIAGTTRQYSTNGSNWTNASGTTQTVTVSENNTTVYARVIDSTNQTSGNATYKVTCIDKELPKVTIAPNGGTQKVIIGNNKINLSTTLSATDAGGSGLNLLQYQFSTGATVPTDYDGGWKNFTNGSMVTEELPAGNYYLYTKVTDVAGNRAESIKKSNVFQTKYQIKYDVNGGSGSIPEQEKIHGTNLNLTGVKPSRTGYTFLGWSRNKNATAAEFSAGATFTSNEACTLYAVWKINSYTVTYNYSANGGTSSTINTKNVNYGANIDLTPVASKSGYTFIGWNTNQNATSKLTSLKMGNGNITLYAIYAKTITGTFYSHNGSGTISTKVSTTIYNKATSGTIKAPTIATVKVNGINRAGRGWSTSSAANATINVGSGANVTLSNNTNYYASYTYTATLTYNLNGGTGGRPANQSVTCYMNYAGSQIGQNITISTTKGTWSGYIFDGWRTSPTQNQGSVISGTYNLYTNVTIYAHWIQIPKIRYQAHCQKYGWMSIVYNGAVAGTVGEGKRLEAYSVTPYYDSSLWQKPIYLEYKSCLYNGEWFPSRTTAVTDGMVCGTIGNAMPLSAIWMDLKDGDTRTTSRYFDVWYRVHVQTYGWLPWTKLANTAGGRYANQKRVEAFQIVITAKGAPNPDGNYNYTTGNQYQAQITPPAHTCNTDNYCNQLHYPGYWWYNCTCGNAHDSYRHPMCSICGKKSPVTWWKCPLYPSGNSMPCA